MNNAVFVLGILLVLCFYGSGEEPNADQPRGRVDVTDFGARGDGETDNTSAFQVALDAVGKTGGTVFVPPGRYAIRGTLEVPRDVAIEGTWRGPARSTDSKGSTLLAFSGKGDPEGKPFLFLNECSAVKGLVIHYPEQVDADPPVPYPWTVRGRGDNIVIMDVLMTNPYRAVDFATFPCGRHYVNRLYAQALFQGIWVDKCFDVGRFENIHFWPFWSGGPSQQFTLREGTAFIFGRTDWQYVSNSFCIGYRTGFLFKAFQDGPGNVLVTQSGSDIGPCAVRVEEVQEHAGVSFTNCQMMAGVEVMETNKGPVKFTSTGFWPIPETGSQAILKGTGHVFFEGCHFSGWDVGKNGVPCLDVRAGGITVTGCDFMEAGKKQIVLGEAVEAAVVSSNRFRGGQKIDNNASGDVQIGLNVMK